MPPKGQALFTTRIRLTFDVDICRERSIVTPPAVACVQLAAQLVVGTAVASSKTAHCEVVPSVVSLMLRSQTDGEAPMAMTSSTRLALGSGRKPASENCFMAGSFASITSASIVIKYSTCKHSL